MPIDLTSLLKEWGVTVGLLSVAATCLLLMFALSMREFFYWFLKLNKIVKNQELILKRIDDLELMLTKKTTGVIDAGNPPGISAAEPVKNSAKPSAQFPIHAKLSESSASSFQLLN